MKSARDEKIYYVNQTALSRRLFHIQMCGITYPDKSYEISRENSAVACLEYIEKGAGVLEIDGQTYTPAEGDSYLLGVGTNHHYYSDKRDPWQKVFINVSGGLLESLVEGYGLKGVYYFKGLDLGEELRAIVALAKERTEDCTEEIICILNRAFYRMRSHIARADAAPLAAERMKEFLRRRASSEFRMEELCKLVSRSESQTIKIFKEAYGTTPYAYFLEKKLRLACIFRTNTIFRACSSGKRGFPPRRFARGEDEKSRLQTGRRLFCKVGAAKDAAWGAEFS